MKRWVYRVGAVVSITLIILQFVPVDRHNPVVAPSSVLNATEAVPPPVQRVIDRSCRDCHSDETHWPWYSYVAPVSWYIAHDVHEARSKMNFSRWGTYSENKKAHEFEEICNELMDQEMPAGAYTLMHPGARLTQEDRAVVCDWASAPRP